MGRKRVFQENAEENEEKYQSEKGGRQTSKDMWTDALTSDQAYEVSKERSDRRNKTKRDAAVLKEATDTLHAVKVEGSLDLVEEEHVSLEALSALVDVAKLKVNYLEALILSNGQIPYKVPKEVHVDQLKKLLDTDPFHPFSPHVQMKCYKTNVHPNN